MKYLLLIFLGILLNSCSVEQRIKDFSYTEEWFYIGSQRYQVYQTRSGCKYIIKLNKNQTRFKRQYIKNLLNK